MNAQERLLQDELNHLLDRMAAMAPEGVVAACAEQRPELVSRLADAEGRLSAARLSLLRGYAAWQDALQECGDLWALADLTGEPAASGERWAA